MKKQALNPKLTHRNKVFSKKVSESQKTAPKTPNIPSKTIRTFRRMGQNLGQANLAPR